MPRALRAARRRPVALLLLAVFLGAGTSLPSLDALLRHGRPHSGERLRPHVESAGGCASHADACTLGRTATGTGATLAPAPVIRIGGPGGGSLEPGPDLPRHTADRGVLPQPRAPPVPAA